VRDALVRVPDESAKSFRLERINPGSVPSRSEEKSGSSPHPPSYVCHRPVFATTMRRAESFAGLALHESFAFGDQPLQARRGFPNRPFVLLPLE